MDFICRQCGGIFTDETCNDRYMFLLSKEFNDKEYFSVHHLTVPCYNLQHNIYSKNGLIIIFDLLDKFINNNLTPEMLKK
jgi:hypothetical protein